MPDIVQKFTGDITDLENKLAKVQADYLKLRDSIAAAKKESKNEDIISGLTSQISSVVKLAAGYTSVSAAVGFAKSSYSEWRGELEEITKTGIKLNADLLAGLERIGALGKTPQAAAFVRTAAQNLGVTREQATAAVTGIMGATPQGSAFGLDTEKQLGIAQQALRLAPYIDNAELQKIAEIAGRIGGMFKDKTPQQTVNLMQSLINRTGENAGEITSPGFLSGVKGLVDAGALTPEEGLGFGTLAIQKQLPANLIERVFAKVNESMTVKNKSMTVKKAKHGVPLSEKNKAENRFAVADAADRFNMILEDQEVQEAVLGQRLAGKIGGVNARITRADIAAVGLALKGDENTALNQTISAVSKTPEGVLAIEQQNVASISDELKRTTDFAEGIRLHREEAQLEKGLHGSNFLVRGVARGWLGFRQFAEAFTEATLGQVPGFGPSKQYQEQQDYLRNEMQTSRIEKAIHNQTRVLTTNQATNAAQAARVNGRE